MDIDTRVEQVQRHPSCARLCIGDRPATEPPAVYGRRVMDDGAERLQPFCKCCNQWLVKSEVKAHEQEGVFGERFAPDAQIKRPIRWECPRCVYDIVSVSAVEPK